MYVRKVSWTWIKGLGSSVYWNPISVKEETAAWSMSHEFQNTPNLTHFRGGGKGPIL